MSIGLQSRGSFVVKIRAAHTLKGSKWKEYLIRGIPQALANATQRGISHVKPSKQPSKQTSTLSVQAQACQEAVSVPRSASSQSRYPALHGSDYHPP